MIWFDLIWFDLNNIRKFTLRTHTCHCFWCSTISMCLSNKEVFWLSICNNTLLVLFRWHLCQNQICECVRTVHFLPQVYNVIHSLGCYIWIIKDGTLVKICIQEKLSLNNDAISKIFWPKHIPLRLCQKLLLYTCCGTISNPLGQIQSCDQQIKVI